MYQHHQCIEDKATNEIECVIVIPRDKSPLVANIGYSNQGFLQHSLILSALHFSAPSSPDKLDSKHHKLKH